MIDLNIKNHQLIIFNKLRNEYICEKYGNLIWCQDESMENVNSSHQFNVYLTHKNTPDYVEDNLWRPLDELNCDEMIMKNILE